MKFFMVVNVWRHRNNRCSCVPTNDKWELVRSMRVSETELTNCKGVKRTGSLCRPNER